MRKGWGRGPASGPHRACRHPPSDRAFIPVGRQGRRETQGWGRTSGHSRHYKLVGHREGRGRAPFWRGWRWCANSAQVFTGHAAALGPVPQQWVLEQLFLKPSPRRPGDTCQGWPVIRQGPGDTCQGWPAPAGPRILNSL